MGTRLFPWINWQEWDQVRALLTAGSDYQRPGVQQKQHLQEGVARVKAWRCRGKVPLSLDVACSLVEAQLMDQQAGIGVGSAPLSQSNASLSQSIVRTAYSLPIIRLVNGIADAQQRGKVAASVASLATAAGLPAMLVDVRHASTHGDLPSLAHLRMAAQQTLLWIRGAYWDSQTAHLANMHTRICSILQALYASWQTSIDKSRSKPADQQSDEDEEVEQDMVGQQQEDGPQMPPVTAKQARKDLLSELRSLILPSWSAALIHPIITTFSQTLTVQSSRQVPEPQAGQTQDKRKRKRGQQQSNQQDRTGIASTQLDKALQSCLLQLMKVYPALGHQLLSCCVYSLGSAGCSHTAKHRRACTCQQATDLLWWPVLLMANAEQQQNLQQVPANDVNSVQATEQPNVSADTSHVKAGYWAIPTEQASAWLTCLLPEPATPFRKTLAKLPPVTQTQHSTPHHEDDGDMQICSESGDYTVAASCLPHMSPPTLPVQMDSHQLTELLGHSLQGLSVLNEMTLNNNGPTTADDTAEGTLDPGSTNLAWLVERLASLLASQQDASNGKPRMLLELAALSLPNNLDKSDPTSGKKATIAAKTQTNAQQETSIEDVSLEKSKLLASATLQKDDTNENGMEQKQRKRWKRVSHWHACALGCLPSPCIPSGVLPTLIPDSSTLLQASVDDREHGNNLNNGMQCHDHGGVALHEQHIDAQDDVQDITREDGQPRFGGWCSNNVDLEIDDVPEQETGTNARHRVAGSWLSAEQLAELGMQVKFL